ncbi:hypothetical protein [Acetomicrobium sp.]
MLTDLSPKFIAYSKLNVKHPVFLEALSAKYENNKYVLELEPLLNALDKFKTYRKSTIFGLEPGVFDNEHEISDRLKNYGEVVPVHEAIQKAKIEVEDLWK